MKIAKDRFQVVSADSVQVYKYLDIGSGKLSKDQMGTIKHHLVDFVDPATDYTVSEYCKQAHDVCESIIREGKVPMFVGGTGMYIDSFFYGLSPVPEISNTDRASLEKELAERGSSILYDELLMVDPIFAKRVHPNDNQRLIRGLSVYRFTGKSLSSYYSKRQGHLSEKTLFIGINEDRDVLRDKIDKRVDTMISSGFVEEVKSLRNRGFSEKDKAMNSLGYLQINNYLKKNEDFSRTVSKIKHDTKKYAKRQMTWFKKNSFINWFKPSEIDKIQLLVDDWYTKN